MHKVGLLHGMQDPTSLTTLCCPIAINKEKAKFKHCMDFLLLCFSIEHWRVATGSYKEKDDVAEATAVIKEVSMVAKE